MTVLVACPGGLYDYTIMRTSSDARPVAYFVYDLPSRSDTYDRFEAKIAPPVVQPTTSLKRSYICDRNGISQRK